MKVSSFLFKRVFVYLFLILSPSLFAQVGIGTSSPQETALLDIVPSLNDKGILIPRIDIPNLNSQEPITGDITNSESLLAYNTNETTGKGFYYWSGSKWIKLIVNEDVDNTNIYNKNGTITENFRTINLDDHIYGYINNETDKDFLYLSPAGVNSDEYYWSSSAGLGFAVGTSDAFVIKANRMATLTSSSSPATPTTGSLVIKHEISDGTGVSSIIFPSGSNKGSDYGYISYEDDGSTNGTTSENGLLTLGIANDGSGTSDTDRDNLNIVASGSVGISNKGPNLQSALDLGQTNKGLLINRVALTSTTSKGPIYGNQADMPESLLVYNTATAGTSPNNVIPGFYYWSANKWNLLQTNGGEKNLYNSNNALSENRTVNLNSKTLDFTGGSKSIRFNPDGTININAYGSGANAGMPTQILGVGSTGNLVELDTDMAYDMTNRDWYKENTNNIPENVNDNIWTNGEVGINTKNPNAPLHIFEETGTPPSGNDGSLILEHGNDGGESSILFKSKVNAGSDYGYISYKDDGDTTNVSQENGLLTIGVKNDGNVNNLEDLADDINLAASGSVGISNSSPNLRSSIDLGQTNKGLLINRVALTSTTSKGPIYGNQVDMPESLLVYNTATAGTSPNNVTPGYYYWSANKWNLLQTAGGEKNLYNSNNALSENRTLNLNSKTLDFVGGANRIRFNPNGTINLSAYGAGVNAALPTQFLGVDATGNLIELNTATAYNMANSDWYKENTTSIPDNVNDNIWTNGEVGINTKNPNAPLHIFEETGTPPSENDGSLILEHGNDGGESSILFKSKVNAGSDYGYISYKDDGDTTNVSQENGLLTIGIKNDGSNNSDPADIDNINLVASGSVGISNISPNIKASLDLGQKNKGLLINRVALTGLNSSAPIYGSQADMPESMLVYNTATAGTSPNNVMPGFYYWYSGKWNRLQNPGGEKNIYNTNGALNEDRTLSFNSHKMIFSSGNGRSLNLVPADPADLSKPFIFETQNAIRFNIDDDPALDIDSEGFIHFNNYGKGNITADKTYNLAVDASGKVIEEKNNVGMQFYSYDIDARMSPDIIDIAYNGPIGNSGYYNSSLNSSAAFPVMIPDSATDKEGFVIKIMGVYNVKNTGEFNFSQTSDDGARIYIDGVLALNDWFDGGGGDASNKINLAKGKHKFEFWYYENAGNENFSFSWGSNPDGRSGVIKASQFTID